MRTRSPRIHLLSLLTLLFLSACFPTSTNPLCEPGKAKADERLSGIWRCEHGNEIVFWFIGKPSSLNDDQGVVELTMLRVGPDGRVFERDDRLSLFTTRIGDHSYLNMTVPRQVARESDAGYLLFRYDVQGDRLTVNRMAEAPVRKAIEQKKLKGEIRGALVLLSDTTDNLQRFVKKANVVELFPEAGGMVFKRMK
jgi:hypothetical protein